jgi:hypothetical protein
MGCLPHILKASLEAIQYWQGRFFVCRQQRCKPETFPQAALFTGVNNSGDFIRRRAFSNFPRVFLSEYRPRNFFKKFP